jgi:hypothetical protein
MDARQQRHLAGTPLAENAYDLQKSRPRLLALSHASKIETWTFEAAKAAGLLRQDDVQLQDLLPAVAFDTDRHRIVVDRDVLADHLDQVSLQLRQVGRPVFAAIVCNQDL